MSMSALGHRSDVTVKPSYWLIRDLAFLGWSLGYTLD